MVLRVLHPFLLGEIREVVRLTVAPRIPDAGGIASIPRPHREQGQ
jgi:hypothetical protein